VLAASEALVPSFVFDAHDYGQAIAKIKYIAI
jgi:hypothetical protein